MLYSFGDNGDVLYRLDVVTPEKDILDMDNDRITIMIFREHKGRIITIYLPLQ